MISPAENYVRYELTHRTVSETQTKLRYIGHPPADEGYLLSLRDEVRKGRPANVKRGRIAAERWYRSKRLSAIHKNTPDMRVAREFLTNPTYRFPLELLIMSGLPDANIAGDMSLVRGKKITEGSIALYRYYFWDRTALTRAQWSDFLKEYENGWELKQAYDAPPSVALWKVGLMSSVDERELMNQLLVDCAMRLAELRHYPNNGRTSVQAERWAGILMQVLKEKKEGPGGVQQILEHMNNMSLKLRAMEIEDSAKYLQNSGEVEIVDLSEHR